MTQQPTPLIDTALEDMEIEEDQPVTHPQPFPKSLDWKSLAIQHVHGKN